MNILLIQIYMNNANHLTNITSSCNVTQINTILKKITQAICIMCIEHIVCVILFIYAFLCNGAIGVRALFILLTHILSVSMLSPYDTASFQKKSQHMSHSFINTFEGEFILLISKRKFILKIFPSN